ARHLGHTWFAEALQRLDNVHWGIGLDDVESPENRVFAKCPGCSGPLEVELLGVRFGWRVEVRCRGAKFPGCSGCFCCPDEIIAKIGLPEKRLLPPPGWPWRKLGYPFDPRA